MRQGKLKLLKRVFPASGNTSRGAGFIEVIIALAILGMVAVAFLNGLSTSLNTVMISDEGSTALALAQGQLVNQRPADAPMTLALVVSNRLSGLIACGVLASWRWWLGLGMLVMWIAVRRPQLALIREQGALYAGGSETLRRAWYLQRLAAYHGSQP